MPSVSRAAWAAVICGAVGVPGMLISCWFTMAGPRISTTALVSPPLASTLSHRIAAAVWVPSAATGSWTAYLPEAVILPRMVPGWRVPEARMTVLRQ